MSTQPSYSRKDKAYAYLIQRQLEAQGIRVWIDKNDIPPGAVFPQEILQAIQAADAVLILWSEHAQSSQFVTKELQEAYNQHMSRNLTIVPLWLDSTALPPQLTSMNATNLICDDAAIKVLISRLNHLRHRQYLAFDAAQTLKAQGAKPLISIPKLVSLPLMESLYCKAQLIGLEDTSLNLLKTQPLKRIAVFFEFLGSQGDEQAIERIYNHLSSVQADYPFLLLHFTGHVINGNYSLTDDEANSPAGDWLDAVNAIHETSEKILGRGGLSLQIFNAVPASLNFALGMKFFKYWHVLLYHYTREKRYQLVFDSNDLG